MSLLAVAILAIAPYDVTFSSLLEEMVDRGNLAKWPKPEFRSLQATSYNRESKSPSEPGWFADSDGVGYVREFGEGSEKRFVLMEHMGPGCITRLWTPFFYYDFNERKGPDVQIVLDGKTVIDEPFIPLVCGKGSVPAPWARFTARAGDLYLPLPFSKSALVTMKKKPFYFSINYRAYTPGVKVETYSPDFLRTRRKQLDSTAQRLTVQETKEGRIKGTTELEPGKTLDIKAPDGSRSIDVIKLHSNGNNPSLRNLVFVAEFDDEQTIWCPVADFFCSTDAIHPMQTLMRQVTPTGDLVSRWVMPYHRKAKLKLLNLGQSPLDLSWEVSTQKWYWNDRSMHFFARWRPDDVVPGSPFIDWNFVDVSGKGVYVGDSWTVANVRKDSWWGEGDEKIYVDGDLARGFPSHFGTGSEDYYGWAGGVYPTVQDNFSSPFLFNHVGGLDGHTRGYNILSRERGLDTIPFKNRLIFDMEASFGTDMREKWNLLGYSVVTFFYARPGSSSNRGAQRDAASRPLISLQEIEKQSDKIKKRSSFKELQAGLQ